MKHIWMAGLFAGIVAGARTAEIPELEAMVGRWLDTRAEITSERLAWQEQQQQLKQELELLETERTRLSAEVSAQQAAGTGQDREDDIAVEEAERLQAALEATIPVIQRAEVDLRAWEKRIPTGFRPELDALFAALPATDQAASHASLGERGQRVIALLAGLETIQAQIHVVAETLPAPDGTRRRVDSLYLGLARGFAVSPDNRWAAVGEAGPDGWTWAERTDLAASVRAAILMVRREEVAGLVALPLNAPLEGKQP